MDLNGTVVVVTGAARGIGKAIARAFGDRGSKVAMVDVLADPLRESVDEIRADGGHVLPVIADISDATQVRAMAESVANDLGPADILVNNAATFSVIGPVWEADPDAWFRDIRINLYGTFLVCRHIVSGMVSRRNGYVINVVSSGGVGDPHPYSTSYASSKTGVMRLTEGLAAEAREHDVKVFAVGPPAIRSEMTKFIAYDPEGRKWRPGFDRLFEEGHGHPPELVAEFILALVGGKADALTGRYFDPRQDLDETLRRSAEIIKDDLYTLRVRGK
jgi:NAD(P)-dependent dehydrogenase (short-subunit alcohol dehydrogenase family)